MVWIKRLVWKLPIILMIYMTMTVLFWVIYPNKANDYFIIFHYWSWLWAQRDLMMETPYNLKEFVTIWELMITLVGILLILILLIGRKIDDSNAYGKASFARSRAQIKRMGLNFTYGLILGKRGLDNICLDKPLSVLLLAPPGTGKTTGIVIPTVLNATHSLVIYDPKGEIYDITHSTKRNHGDVLLFDPTIEACAKYNPLSFDILPKSDDQKGVYVRNISKILIRSSQSDSNTFFYKEAQNAFVFFALWCIWQEGRTSFRQIRDLILSENKVSDAITTMCPELKECDDKSSSSESIRKWNDNENMLDNDGQKTNKIVDETPEYLLKLGRSVLNNADNNRIWSAVISILRESLDVFESDMVAAATDSGCDFTAETLRERTQTVYLRVKDIDKERLAPLMSIVFTSLSSGLLSKLPENSDHMVTFILDEFVRLGKMDAIIDMPSIGRGYNFNAMFIAQDYGQIIDLYGRDKLSAIESNTAYKIVLTQNNAETAKKISEQIGNTTRKRYSESESSNTRDINNKGLSKSYSYESVPLLSAQDIMNMEIGQGLLLSQNHFQHPIKITLPYYFKTPEL